jgi:hypothetical protein
MNVVNLMAVRINVCYFFTEALWTQFIVAVQTSL